MTRGSGWRKRWPMPTPSRATCQLGKMAVWHRNNTAFGDGILERHSGMAFWIAFWNGNLKLHFCLAFLNTVRGNAVGIRDAPDTDLPHIWLDIRIFLITWIKNVLFFVINNFILAVSRKKLDYFVAQFKRAVTIFARISGFVQNLAFGPDLKKIAGFTVASLVFDNQVGYLLFRVARIFNTYGPR